MWKIDLIIYSPTGLLHSPPAALAKPPPNTCKNLPHTRTQKYSQIYSKQRGIDSAETQLFDSSQLKETVDKKGLDKTKMVAFTDGDKNKDQIMYEANKINKGTHFIEALGRENKRQDQI